jgi:phage-related protein
MAFPVFPASPGPVFPVTFEREPVVLSASFGDGYGQSVVDGISGRDTGVLNLSWDLLTEAEKDVFEAFLSEHGGVGNFTYAVPGYDTYTFRCDSWSAVFVAHDVWGFRATFNRAFEVE